MPAPAMAPNPVGPTHLKRRSWWGVLRRTARQFKDKKLTDWAAALTYYSVLSIFPGIIVLVSILNLLPPSATQSLISTIQDMGPGSGTAFLVDAIKALQGARSLAGPLAIVGVAFALVTASTYMGAFIRAANSIYETEEHRPLWKTVPLRIGLTVVMVGLVALCGVGVVATGSVAVRLGHWLGVGSAVVTVWDIAKWPVLAVLIGLATGLLYWAAPNARQPGFRWLTPGCALAVLVWIAASAGFAVYVTNFGSYNKLYGSLGGAVIALVWLWITNIAVLLGAAFDAELARGRTTDAAANRLPDMVSPPGRADT